MAPLPLRVFLTLYVLLNILAQWIISWVLQVLFIVLSYPFVSPVQRVDVCSLIFRYISYIGVDVLNPFWHVKVLRPLPFYPTEGGKAGESRSTASPAKVIIAMNHVGTPDPFLALRAILPHDSSWIAKDELFRVPFGGWCMANAGDIPIIFKNKKESNETVKGTVALMMEQVKTRLRRGRPIAVFPEGTRNKNPENGLQPFKDGFFRLAVEEGAWILPLAISGTERAWPKGSKLLDTADTYFSWGAPVDARTYNGDYAKLRDDVWQAITDLRDAHPDRRKLA